MNIKAVKLLLLSKNLYRGTLRLYYLGRLSSISKRELKSKIVKL